MYEYVSFCTDHALTIQGATVYFMSNIILYLKKGKVPEESLGYI